VVKKLQRPRKASALAAAARSPKAAAASTSKTAPKTAAASSPKIKPVVVDIYHGDAVKSFAAARKAGIHGVIHKATEGRTRSDSAYARRRAKATDAGLLWGAYHFMKPGDPVAQADHFIDTAKPDPKTMMAIDHEHSGVPLANAITFMQRIEERIGRKVVIYSGALLKEQLRRATAAQKSYLAGRRLWLSHFNARPKWPSIWRAPWLWQFTGEGIGPRPHSIPGMQDKLDVDSYAGTPDRLAAEWAGEKVAAPAGIGKRPSA
jgi:GH25 family lysozyme M1 (1,4-beta-N-acetylmuramidase)